MKSMKEEDWIVQFLDDCLKDVKENFMGRSVFAIWRVLEYWPEGRKYFERIGVQKTLHVLLLEESNEENVKMIEKVLDKLESDNDSNLSMESK